MRLKNVPVTIGKSPKFSEIFIIPNTEGSESLIILKQNEVETDLFTLEKKVREALG